MIHWEYLRVSVVSPPVEHNGETLSLQGFQMVTSEVKRLIVINFYS